MSNDASGDIYEGFTLVHIAPGADEDVGEEDAAGWYVKIHEVIAILRFEAMMAREQIGDGFAAHCMDGIADAFADQAVCAMEAHQKP